VFAVLVDDGVASGFGNQSRVAVSRALAGHGVVAGEWASASLTRTGGQCAPQKPGQAHGHLGSCVDGPEAKQLKQWARCLALIEAHEATVRGGAPFDLVLKVRPDDLWYGALVPSCALAPNVALVSRMLGSRLSDQVMLLPRRLATSVLGLADTDLRTLCSRALAPATMTPGRSEDDAASGATSGAGGEGLLGSTDDPHFPSGVVHRKSGVSAPRFGHGVVALGAGFSTFEETVFGALRLHAKALGVAVVPTLLPRVLTRPDPAALADDMARHRAEKDIETKCSRYLWFESRAECRAVMVGQAVGQAVGQGA
jgi:hypothetical protein